MAVSNIEVLALLRKELRGIYDHPNPLPDNLTRDQIKAAYPLMQSRPQSNSVEHDKARAILHAKNGNGDPLKKILFELWGKPDLEGVVDIALKRPKRGKHNNHRRRGVPPPLMRNARIIRTFLNATYTTEQLTELWSVGEFAVVSFFEAEHPEIVEQWEDSKDREPWHEVIDNKLHQGKSR